MVELFSLSFIFFGIVFCLGGMAAPNFNEECTIPRIPNGLFVHFLSNKLIKVPHNTRAYVSCDNGYTAEGPPDVICQNGTWPQALPKCQPKKCQPPFISNGILSVKEGYTNLIEHEKSLSVSCNDGYNMNGSSNIACLLGKWYPQPPTCDPKSCLSDLIENGVLVHQGTFLDSSSTKIAHGQQVLVSCNNGYSISELEMNIVCQLGQWSSPFPQCQPESCIPKPVSNGRSLVLGRDIAPFEKVENGLTLSVICASDYVIHGEGLLSCNKGKWSHHFPTCKPKFCLGFNVTHGKIFYEGKELSDQVEVQHRSNIFVKCDSGYSLIGTAMLTCSYGHWSHNKPECIPKGCHAQTVLQGSVSYLEKELTNTCSILSNGLVSHQHSVSISCLEGFQRNGPEILSCSFGNWSEKFPTCQPRSCNVQTISNGKALSMSGIPVSKVPHSEKVSIVCNEGYEMTVEDLTETIHCFYGNWTGKFPSCRSQKCKSDFVPNGHVFFGNKELKFSTSDPATLRIPDEHHVSVSCDLGFNLTGLNKIKCNKGKWMKSFPKCQPSGCPVHLVENGIVKESGSNIIVSDWGKILHHGQNIDVTCKSGYELEGVHNLKCLFGNWSATLPVCHPKSCAVIPIQNAHLAYEDSMNLPFVKHNKFVQVTCEVGFTLLGSNKIKCSEGAWCSTFPTCEPDKCDLKEVTNGILSINHEDIRMNKQPVAHNTIVSIKCQQGFDLTGVSKIQCLNGKWSTEFPVCEGKKCKAVSIENGFLKEKSSGKVLLTGDEVSANETVHILCDSGHNLKESTEPIQCKMGKWSKEFPKCQPDVFCDLLPVDSGVVVIGKGPWVPGAVVKFKCDRPICELLGESSITCLENGKWSEEESPFCDCGA